MPKDLRKLTNLRALCWRHNGLKGVPKPILEMSDLVVLQLGGNDFGTGEGLPDVWPFPGLKELDLGHSNLKTTEIYTAVDRTYLKEVHRTFHPRG